MICIYIPKALAELYHAQGWEIFTMRHKLYSGHLLACQAILEADQAKRKTRPLT